MSLGSPTDTCSQCNGNGDNWDYPPGCVACEKCGGSGHPPYVGDVIAVWVSCGAASAVAAKKTVEKYNGFCTVKLLNNPVHEEDEDNARFLKDVGEWCGLPIEIVQNEKFPSCSAKDVWTQRKFMSGLIPGTRKGFAPCTFELKKEARQQWEAKNKVDWHVLGFTADEQERHKRFILTERSNVLPILIDEKITKAQCFDIISAAGLKLPRIYHLGYPNANCIGCVKATSPEYWNHVRKAHPEIFKDRAEQSRELGCKLVRVKGQRLFLDELPPDAKGRPMKTMKTECGIFCEEKP